MGYDIIYEGRIDIDKPLDEKTTKIINSLSDTRRQTWDAAKLERDGIALIKDIGVHGEFFFMDGFSHKEKNELVRKYVISDAPPSGQPWCWGVWVVTPDRKGLVWNRNEGSYAGKEWLIYIIYTLLLPSGYHTNGTINWFSENDGKFHTTISNDRVVTRRGYIKNEKIPDLDAWDQELIDSYVAYHQNWLSELDKNKIQSLGKRRTNGEEVSSFNLLINDTIVQVSYSNRTIVSSEYLYVDIVKENNVYGHSEVVKTSNGSSHMPDKTTVKSAFEMIEKYISEHPDYLENDSDIILY